MAATSFFFVDVSRVDSTTKSRARSHVLKGKNAGRKLKSRSKLQHAKTSTSSDVLVTKQRVYCSRKDLERSSSSLSPTPLGYSPFNTGLITFTYPVDDTPQYECLIKSCTPCLLNRWVNYLPIAVLVYVVEALYPPRLCQSLHKPRSYWFHMFSKDQMCKYVAPGTHRRATETPSSTLLHRTTVISG